MGGWRFYARRPGSGVWLDTDVQLDAEITEELNGPGVVSGVIPHGLVKASPDAYPMWRERDTLLYAEQDGALEWYGFCSYVGSSERGQELEFTGSSGVFDVIAFEGIFRQWEPTAKAVCEALIGDAQKRARDNIGLVVDVAGVTPDPVGDTQPPAPPKKPGRRKGESKEAYDDRLLTWEMAVDDWETEYGDLTKYKVMWWESPMIGDELRRAAEASPFEYREVHRWTDRATLTAEHLYQISDHHGVRREDIAFIDGFNLAEQPIPETDFENYANEVIVLGKGKKARTKKARVASGDGRMTQSKIVRRPRIGKVARLTKVGDKVLARSLVTTRLEQVRVWDTSGNAPIRTLKPGDEVRVESDYTFPPFSAYARIVSITRSTANPGTATIRFE